MTLVLVSLALAIRPTRIRLLLGQSAGIAFLYALGPFTPLQDWAYRFAPLYDRLPLGATDPCPETEPSLNA